MQIQSFYHSASLRTQEAFKSLQKTLYNGMQILSGQGKAPAKAPDVRPEIIVLREPGATWGNYLQDQKASNHSLHHIYNLQHDLLTVAATILDRQDPVLMSMANQMELAKVKADRPATKQEEAAAKALKKNLIELIAKQQQSGLPAKEAYRLAAATFRDAQVKHLNSQPWQTIKNTLTHNGHQYTNTQLPAADMKIGTQDIFPSAYQGKGVCSWDTKNIHHANNLWMSTVSAHEDGKDKTLFCGIRHGVLSPYDVKDPLLRQTGAENKAKEVLTAALFSKPELRTRALEGEAVNLKLVSVGLLTASNVLGKEGTMVEDQMRAWQSLTQPGKMIHLKIRNKDGELQTVKIKPEIAAFNVGVNELALKLGFGLKTSDSYNVEALHQLLGNDLRPEAKPGGWVGDWLAQYPDNYKVVNILARQIKDIWKNNLHHKDGGEPYKLAQRLAMLANEIDAVPAWNCKSGKDRTGMMDSEIKRETISLHQTHTLNAPGSLPDRSGQEIFQKVLLNSGNLEIQKQNTGGAGNKVMKNLSPEVLNLSYQKRVGDENIWQSVKGISSLITS
ncbi:type III secretion system effector inositol phosphate phosphatase [Salmonella enterica subsp. diarizonae]|uniref:type III secretion system effector inositol phosphate phosphatase n=1 Tax=Salmonella enterica TaxID=28901 RepID=UPI0003BC93B7|nr:type III secretion system effector inositol phosphate phosphatase [Salmonella enterica]EAW1824028.1 type III secretion system effector inositol phosphate phosphatase [Salmonella enterica subsp. diarizonae]EBR3855733.1 type III secretion system effector inositol phosphate phosphatase [Salmonella enterica subsp. enterica]ECT9716591.1 type III secretion system effector inositol phosphate phosphatase [Salmonella enterica subsp. diarizonae str. CFSAN000553]EDT6984036.1 type III secretion system e